MLIKRLLTLLLIIILTSCGTNTPLNGNGKINIICTAFPQYDLTRIIAGDLANIELLNIGADTHNFEPKPSDIIKIEKSDLFICIGGENDIWEQTVLPTLNTGSLEIVKLMGITELLEADSVEVDEHDHHLSEYDEHVWTNPNNAILIVDEIYRKLSLIDSRNEVFYFENKEKLIGELKKLDNDIKTALLAVNKKPLVFGDRFAFKYFTEEYDLEHYSAFPGCSTETDVSASAITSLIETVRENSINAVYYLENGTESIADTICNETGAVSYMLHSCQSVTSEEINNGISYINLMYDNLENILKGFE